MKMKPFIIENLVFPIGDLLLGTQVRKQLQIQREYSQLNEEGIALLQESKLKSLLKHATATCEYYKLFSNEKLKGSEWIKHFPILTKQMTLKENSKLISSNYQIKNLIKYESSGSSGVRSLVYIDKKEQSIMRAILINWWEWNGYYIGKPIFQTGMSPERGFLKSFKDKLFATYYFTAFGMDEKSILAALNDVCKKRKMHLFGYASSLYELAKVANKNKLNLQFDLAMSQGDKLFDHYAIEINKAFKCNVVEDYGLNEGFMIGQKKDLPFFYINSPNVYVEILDENNLPVPDGQMGRIIATKLDGYAMPLIRYDTGDLGIMLPREQYPKKRDLQFPLLEKVVGRNTDIIRTEDGKTLIVHTFTGIFEFFPEIQQFQVVQNKIDSIIFNYIPSDKFNKSVLMKIEELFRKRTHSSIEIIWEKVNEILPSKSGKPQIIINNLIKQSLTEKE
jgi:phenylacetate-CoA ligase